MGLRTFLARCRDRLDAWAGLDLDDLPPGPGEDDDPAPLPPAPPYTPRAAYTLYGEAALPVRVILPPDWGRFAGPGVLRCSPPGPPLVIGPDDKAVTGVRRLEFAFDASFGTIVGVARVGDRDVPVLVLGVAVAAPADWAATRARYAAPARCTSMDAATAAYLKAHGAVLEWHYAARRGFERTYTLEAMVGRDPAAELKALEARLNTPLPLSPWDPPSRAAPPEGDPTGEPASGI